MFQDFDGSDVLDQGMPKKAPIIYGGHKKEEKIGYLLTKVFNPACEEVSIEEALQDYELYDSHQKLIPATVKNLPHIFSSFIDNRKTHDIKINLNIDESKIVDISDSDSEEEDEVDEEEGKKINPECEDKIVKEFLKVHPSASLTEIKPYGKTATYIFNNTRKEACLIHKICHSHSETYVTYNPNRSIVFYKCQHDKSRLVLFEDNPEPIEMVTNVKIAEYLKKFFSDRFIYSFDDVLRCFNGRIWEAREDVMRLTITKYLLETFKGSTRKTKR